MGSTKVMQNGTAANMCAYVYYICVYVHTSIQTNIHIPTFTWGRQEKDLTHWVTREGYARANPHPLHRVPRPPSVMLAMVHNYHCQPPCIHSYHSPKRAQYSTHLETKTPGSCLFEHRLGDKGLRLPSVFRNRGAWARAI